MKKLICLTLAFILVLSLLAGCAGGATPTEPDGSRSTESNASTPATSAKKTVSIAISENLFDLDPLNSNSLPARINSFNIFEPLYEFDHKGTSGEFYPCLATEYSVDDTGCVWTFKLREGVKFHNGEDFNADDVVCTFNRLLEDKSLSCANQFWPYLSAVEKVDNYTVKISTSQPYAATLISVCYTPIIPNEAYTEKGTDLFLAGAMYGTGPWVFDEWVDGAYTHYTKNENYWNKENYNTAFEDMYVRYILESSSAIAAHLSGEVDAYVPSNGIDPELLGQYANAANTELISLDTGTFNYFGFNCANGAFADINCRMAFEYALDRQLICNTIYGGAAKVPNSVILDTVPGYDPDLAPYTYDPDEAKDFLAKSSYDGHEIVLYSSAGLNLSEETLLAVSEMLNAVGFNTRVEIVEGATFTTLRKAGEYEVFLINDMTVGGDLAKYIAQKITGDSHKHGLKDEKLMEIATRILTTIDPGERAAAMTEYGHYMREIAAPHSILAQFNCTYAINKDITGIDLWTDGTFGFKYVNYAG